MSQNQDNGKLQLLYGFSPPVTVYITQNPTTPKTIPQENTLTFHIANPRNAPLLKFINTDKLTPSDHDRIPKFHRPDPVKNLSQFHIYFPWGDGTGDLCTQEEGTNIVVSPGPDNDSWYALQSYDPTIGTYWRLFPRGTMLFDSRDSISFLLSQIISVAKPGLTYMIIETQNIPGYNDEVATVAVFKKYPTLSIPSFRAKPGTIAKGGAAKLEWKTLAAQSCTLDPGNIPVKLNGVSEVAPCSDQRYTLTASDGPRKVRRTLTLYVSRPRINFFRFSPDVPINAGEPFTLEWDVDFASSCSIDPGIGPVDIKGRQTVTPKHPTTYTLTANSLDDYEKAPPITTNMIMPTSFEISMEAACDFSANFETQIKINAYGEAVSPQKSDPVPSQSQGPIQKIMLVLIDPASYSVMYSKLYYPPYETWYATPQYSDFWQRIIHDLQDFSQVRWIILFAAAGVYSNYKHFPAPEFYKFLLSCGATLSEWEKIYQYSDADYISNYVFVGASHIGKGAGREVFTTCDESSWGHPKWGQPIPAASIQATLTPNKDGALQIAVKQS